MANAVEEALKRASPEQREKNEQDMQAAKEKLSSTNMKEVENISAPNVPNAITKVNSSSVANKQVDEVTKDNINSIQKSEGNNYLNQNAVDRAMDRTPQEPPRPPQPQKEMER